MHVRLHTHAHNCLDGVWRLGLARGRQWMLLVVCGMVDGGCELWMMDDGGGWRIVNDGLCTGAVVAVVMYTPTRVTLPDAHIYIYIFIFHIYIWM